MIGCYFKIGHGCIVWFLSQSSHFHSRSLERTCKNPTVVIDQIYCGAHSGSDRPLQPKGLGKWPTFCNGLRLHVPALLPELRILEARDPLLDDIVHRNIDNLRAGWLANNEWFSCIKYARTSPAGIHPCTGRPSECGTRSQDLPACSWQHCCLATYDAAHSAAPSPTTAPYSGWHQLLQSGCWRVPAPLFSVRVEKTPLVLRHDIGGEGRGLFETVTQYNQCAWHQRLQKYMKSQLTILSTFGTWIYLIIF